MHLVGSVLFGADDAVMQFVSSRIDNAQFGPCTALGIIKDHKLVGGVVFHELRGKIDVRVSIALDWAGFCPWRTLFSYPFNHLGVTRLTAVIDKKNKKSRALVQGLGFKHEGVHPLAIDGTATAVSYGMTRKDCRWIRT